MDTTPHPQAAAFAPGQDAPDAVVTRSEERLVVATRTVRANRVTVRRRIVTEERTVQVTVRREELVLEQQPADGEPVDATELSATSQRAPIVMVLHEQVPEVVLRTQPYEQVTVSVVATPGTHHLSETVRKEVVAVDMQPPAEPAGTGR